VGPLTLPPTGSIYADSNVFIYSIERIDPYRTVLDDFWLEVRTKQAAVITSELALLFAPNKPP